ncbi:Predicted N-formylglutamate amidohydrolase [Cribrihabitans marinus]|uniref:Predicted N-formylglutamate amidohydrolase n=1 Tax=Cribrihabitans marinus TaxID=1227549 RepID=A0A1H6R9X2_9RHOB|nr:N-formylglutamate amidohydrolase [Cribrihabitans marinus]SEI48415.1 Predicted N-formylglutamate amidohydrolase [Cribrihabitans marinus]
MATVSESPLLTPLEGPPVRVLNASGPARAVLVCEHASRFIPATLRGLGLDAAAAQSHAAWDIGAMELAVELMGALDAPLVAARVSRLVYDCNRPPEAPDSIPAKSEVYDIPGNTGLSTAERDARGHEIYAPFRATLAGALDARPDASLLITVHSFTPVYNGRRRDVELGILHDADDRAARHLLRALGDSGLRTALNEPYSAADGVTHTLRAHAIGRGLANVMIEVRNDLLDTPAGVNRIAGLLTPALARVIAEMDPESAPDTNERATP